MNEIYISLKAQDRLREWFSKRGLDSALKLTCLSLGDSDIDYRLSPEYEKLKTIPSVYNMPSIKHKLIYEGSASNVTGVVTMYLRKVSHNGQVLGLYNYPPNLSTYSFQTVPPKINNGFDFNFIDFDQSENNKEGFVVFLQTVPDNYKDESGNPMRLNEPYKLETFGLPNSWEIIYDEPNGSFLIAKPDNYVFLNKKGKITITGKLTSLTNIITFNY